MSAELPSSMIFLVQMPWVSPSFAIDDAKVSDYGGVKITKAQIVKENDEELIQLKMIEIEEGKKAISSGQKCSSRIRVEYTRLAGFYLD
jgi:hypothetical protein